MSSAGVFMQAGRRTPVRAAVATALLVAAAPARANPPDTWGALARGTATAGAQTAGADDAGAAYYNPAGLALGDFSKASVSLGYAAGVPVTFIERARQTEVANESPGWQGWYTLAGRFPLGGKRLGGRAALGLLVYHPQDKLVRVSSLDPKTPQFYRYEAGPDRMALAVSLGLKLADWISVGAGANVLAGLEGKVIFDIDMFAKRIKRRDLDFALRTAPAPIVGVSLTPAGPWKLGLVWRGPVTLNVREPNTLGLGDVGTLILDVRTVVHYTPHQLSAGVQYQPDKRLKLAADVTWSMWRLAPDPSVQVGLEVKGKIPEGLGLDEALAFATQEAATGFRDTVAVSVGGELLLPDGTTVLSAGLGWRPTFVPDQVQATNYLDNSAFLAGAGLSFQFRDPTEVFSGPLRLDLAAQVQAFVPRDVVKVQEADPVGNYRFGGAAVAGGAAVRYEF